MYTPAAPNVGGVDVAPDVEYFDRRQSRVYASVCVCVSVCKFACVCRVPGIAGRAVIETKGPLMFSIARVLFSVANGVRVRDRDRDRSCGSVRRSSCAWPTRWPDRRTAPATCAIVSNGC